MMRPIRRHSRQFAWLPTATLVLVMLTACAGGTRVSQLPTPPDPPPIPLRKPAIPANFTPNPPATAPRVGASVSQDITATALPLPQRKPQTATLQETAAPPQSRQTATATPVPPRKPANPAAAATPSVPAAETKPQAAAQVSAPNAQRYTVAPGENVFSIARKLNVPIRSLLEVNRLGPPYKLAPGQQLIVPIPTRHIVTRGDTVYGISRRYRIDIRSLVQLNRIPPPYRISVGQVLNLPGSNNAFDAATPQLAAADVRETGASPPAASAPDVNQQATAAVPVTPQASGTQQARGPAPLPTAKPKQGTAPAAPAAATRNNPKTSAQPTQAARVAPPKPNRRPPAGVPKPPPRSSGKFLWPLQGRIISSYGSKGGGVHNDGINIEAPAGATVRAAENGVVAYSGNELRGFGRLLLIRHADGWVTAYAHLNEVLVSRGDTVKRGQAIAKVGRSGNVSKPQLHFEIRQGTRAVDPRKLLGKQQAQR